MNTKSLLTLTAMVVTMGSVSSAHARNLDLVNQALDKTLSERARVERSYETKVDRPGDDFREKNDRHIEVVMDGEIGGGSGGMRMRDSERSDRKFRERDVESKLAKEAREIDRGFEEDTMVAERKNVREHEIKVMGRRTRK